MKKTLSFLGLMLLTGISAFAQNITNPAVGRAENTDCSISKIETTDKYTIVSFEYTAPSDDAWANVNKEIFIKTDLSDKHYNFVKAENITLSPEKTYLTHAGDKITFKAYFQKVPKAAKLIDVIESEDGDGSTAYFNYYKVSLTESQGKIVRTVTIAPPPPIGNTPRSTFSVGGMNVFEEMAPAFKTMTKSMMDAQLDYYKQPGKVAEIAKLNRDYFNALVKEGFTEDQALKIVTAESLLPKANTGGK
jgi:hypothetical protein